MARNITVQSIIDNVRYRGDYDETDATYTDSFITDTHMINFISSGYAELHDKLVQADESYFITEHQTSLTASVENYDLPSDFYKLRGIDININSSDWIPMERFSWHERGGLRYSGNNGLLATLGQSYSYDLLGTQVKVLPVPNESRTFRITYVPVAAELTSSLQTIDGVNGFEELITLYALRRCQSREGVSTSTTDGEIGRQEQRINTMRDSRDQAQPTRLSDPDLVLDWWRVR